MIGTILTEIVCSVYMMKNIATISSAKVKVFALLILGLLVSSLVLRAKSGIFLKEEGKSHSMLIHTHTNTQNLSDSPNFVICVFYYRHA